jgi:orotate phosphoribosyltransferase
VISAGTSVRESIAMITAAGGTPHAVSIALDRQEKASDEGEGAQMSAVQFVQQQLGLQVVAIATLADLLHYLRTSANPALSAHLGRVAAYRERYGV